MSLCEEISGDVQKRYSEQYIKPVIDVEAVEQEADYYFYSGLESLDKTTRDAYFLKALEKYTILLNYSPYDVVSCTQVAVIHENLGHLDIAKEYFKRAYNLKNFNPFANFYFAEYYFSQKDYSKALEHYLIAYNNGYNEHYQVSLRIATIYEKFGDFKKAKQYYRIAKKLNPELNKEIVDKIQSFRKIYYTKYD